MTTELKDFQPFVDAASDLARCKMHVEGKTDNETWVKYFLEFLVFLIPWGALVVVKIIK